VSLMLFGSWCWIEANERRSALDFVKSSVWAQSLLKALGWMAVLAAFFLIAQSTSWERAIPIGLAWCMGIGVLSLLFAARFQRLHLRLVVPAAALAIVSGIAVGVGAGT